MSRTNHVEKRQSVASTVRRVQRPHGLADFAAGLANEEAIRNAGFELDLSESGAIIVFLMGSFRGAWSRDGEIFEWTPAGYGGPQATARSTFEAAEVMAALLRQRG